MRSKSWTGLSAIFAVLGMTVWLTGCFCTGRGWPEYEHPRQGQYLYLQPGETYQAEQAEKWISPIVLREKDEIILSQQEQIERLIRADALRD